MPHVPCYRYRGYGSSYCTSWMMTLPPDPSYRAGMDGATMTARGASAVRWLVRAVRGDVVLAVVAGLIQVGGTALAARHQTDVRMLDVPGYLLLAAGPAALIVRRRWPVAVLWVAFATALCYLLLGYPGGPIWIALIVAFGTALFFGHRIAAYISLLVGYPCFGWLVNLVNGQPLPSGWVAGGLAAEALYRALRPRTRTFPLPSSEALPLVRRHWNHRSNRAEMCRGVPFRLWGFCGDHRQRADLWGFCGAARRPSREALPAFHPWGAWRSEQALITYSN